MNKALALLLKLDPTTIKRPSKEVEIKRLSELAGEPVVFKLQALSPDEMEEIQENAIKDLKTVDIDIQEMKLFTVIAGVVEPSLKDKDLQKQFDAQTPKDLVYKLLLSGEIDGVYKEIQELSGYGDDSVKAIKN